MKVLVTGAAGFIGAAVCAELKARGHWVRGADLKHTPGTDESLRGNLSSFNVAWRAVDGMEAVVHLAATPWDADFIRKLAPNNIVAVYNVLESSRQEGVKRVVLASSIQTVLGHKGPWPATPAMLPAPRNLYGVTKLFAEHAGEVYAHQHGLSVIAVRVGWCPRTADDARSVGRSGFGRDIYLSPRDAGRFFACAVEARCPVLFAALYATSKPVRKMRYDLRPARKLIGYEPLDTYPAGTETLR